MSLVCGGYSGPVGPVWLAITQEVWTEKTATGCSGQYEACTVHYS